MNTTPHNDHSNPFAAGPMTRGNLRAQKLATFAFGCMTLLILIPLILLMGNIFIKAAPAISWDFITDVPRNGMRAGGIWPALIGTLYLVCFTMTVSAPIGIMAGIYLSEFAKDNWFTRAVQLAVVNLAGVPSIVYALFGVGAFVVFAGLGKSILAAAMTVGIMTLPVYIVTTREALQSVPMAFRTAAWNLGATRWQTIRTLVLPHSAGSILTAVIFDVCRTAGETAPIMFTGAVFFKFVERGDFFPYSPTDQCMALSYHLYTLATQVPNVPQPMLYGTAAVLLGFILTFNSVAIAIRIRMRLRKKW